MATLFPSSPCSLVRLAFGFVGMLADEWDALYWADDTSRNRAQQNVSIESTAKIKANHTCMSVSYILPISLAVAIFCSRLFL